MITTKSQEAPLAFPLEQPIDALPPSVLELPAEQKVTLAEAEKRLEQQQQEWASIVQALEDNSMAVFRAMRRLRHESEPEQVERVLTSFEDGRFLIDRMGAESTVDPDLAIVLLTRPLSRRIMPVSAIFLWEQRVFPQSGLTYILAAARTRS